MATLPRDENLRLALPKGRMCDGVLRLLAEAGVQVHVGPRQYRPQISLPGFEVKILKPQSIIRMLHHGSRDLGFAGHDWVEELGVEVVEVLDTGLDPVRLVAAMPAHFLEDGAIPDRPLVVASEYPALTCRWIEARGLRAEIVQSWGATEVYPPEDADCIVDNTATGATLLANDLQIVDELQLSSTRLYANPRIMDDPRRRDQVEGLALLLRSVLDARRRVMVEVNVGRAELQAIVDLLPCMREPTVSALHGEAGYAVKAAVPRSELPGLIPRIRAAGGTDLVVTTLSQIVP